MAQQNFGGIKVQPVPRQGRVNRHPKHPFRVNHRPFEITPFLLAPVLPGETLKNLLLQSRAVTDPILSPLIGWWLEYYVFYVKHRDLDARDTLTAMMLNPATDVSALRDASGTTWTYTADDAIDWVTPCLKRVVEEYFRADGETWNGFVITAGRPAASYVGNNWTDSLVDRVDIVDPLEITVDTLSGGSSDAVKISEIDAALRQYQFLRDNALINMTYEDYLATFGVRPTLTELHRPELIRYVRDWQYPSNTINPSTGAPTSAVSWVIAERADKDRYFKEPGFIFGVTVARPKVYLKKQTGSAAGAMDNAYAWLPAIMSNDPRTSLKELVANNGPIQATTNNYVFDIRDLLLYGDQFINFALTDTQSNLVNVPNDALDNMRYPLSADVDTFFVSASPANQVRQDGIVSLTIAGPQIGRAHV